MCFLLVKGGCTNKKHVVAQITLKRLETVATGSRFIACVDIRDLKQRRLRQQKPR